MPSTKFKVGDRVKVVMPGNGRDGKLGVVKEIKTKAKWPYKVLLAGRSAINGFTENQLDLDLSPVKGNSKAAPSAGIWGSSVKTHVPTAPSKKSSAQITKFNQGDRVVCVSRNSHAFNKQGTVTQVGISGYLVIFDGNSSGSFMLEHELDIASKQTKQLASPVLPGKQLASMGSNGNSPWIWTHGWHDLADAVKNAGSGQVQEQSHSSKCNCGSRITYGDNTPWNNHTDYCDIYKAGKEQEDMMKALEKK